MQQLVAHPKYFQFGFDFHHLPPGFYLELNIHAGQYSFNKDDLCLKYSATKAQQHAKKMHAMSLPQAPMETLALAPDIKQLISDARDAEHSGHELEILINSQSMCMSSLNYLKAMLSLIENISRD